MAPAARLPAVQSQRDALASVLKVTVQVGARKFDEDLAVQAQIAPDIEQMSAAMASNPSRFAEWAMLEAMARAVLDAATGRVENANSDLKVLEADLFLRWNGEKWNDKILTVDGVKAKVLTDPSRLAAAMVIRRMAEEVLAAKEALEKIAVGRKTIEQKRDSLLALASNWRKEMDTQLQLRASQYRPGAGPR